MSSLLALALLVLVVPVGIALVQAATQLRQLANQTDQLVRQGVELAGQTQSLFRLLSTLERSTNLYLVLGDPRVLEASRATQEQVFAVTDRLAALSLDDAGGARLSDLRSAVAGALAVVTFEVPPGVDRAALLTRRLEEVNAAADELSDASNAMLDARLRALEARATETRQTLFMWLAAVIPATLALGLLFAVAVLRPLRQIDRVITELGGGTFSKPIVIRGTSDIEALGRQLEWLRLRLLELGEEKNRFLRQMSHELKTPLANLREGTDLLLDGAVGPLDANQLEVAGILRENALRLQQLIENLLSYSAWQSRSAQLEITRFPLTSLVGTVTDSQRLALAARDIQLDIDVGDILLPGDRGKLKLVLDNLLSNALKFTPRGGTIHIHGYREGNRAVIDFADSGPGIPEHEHGRVFDDFFTGTVPQTGPLKGTGIGLSVVREFVQAHGGTVEISTGRFRGAHFRICLPIESARSGSGDADAA